MINIVYIPIILNNVRNVVTVECYLWEGVHFGGYY